MGEQGELHLFDIYKETRSFDLVIGGSHELLARQLRDYYLRSQNILEANAILVKTWVQVILEENEANRDQASRTCRLLDFRSQIIPNQHGEN